MIPPPDRQPVEAALRQIEIFSDLRDDQLQWFASNSEELSFSPGDVLIHEGDPADALYVLIEGEIRGRKESGGADSPGFIGRAGQVLGMLPFSRMTQFPLTARATSSVWLLRLRKERFPEMLQRIPELLPRLIGVLADRIREYSRAEQQRDKLSALGKLSAGLAHELNNPASAAKRAATQLRDLLKRIRDASHELGRRDLTPAQKSEIERLETSLTQVDGPPLDALAASELEDQLDSLLRSHGQNDLWQLAADLARKNFKPEVLERLFGTLDADTARAALVRISASVEIADLLNQIEHSTSRISELVGAIKEYTFMDQSPVQNVDIVKTLETTLTILNHKLKRGVTVQRDYQKIPLLVNSFGSELNQVWTNIIDNAIDAMGGKGELRVRTYREDDCVVVEIRDNGPGISPEVRPHIFEPFFTTKGVGEGTGLGLDTVQRIVKKHRGNIQVESKPGDTSFQVWLPLSQSAG